VKITSLEPAFVDAAPEPLDEGVLYISTKYANVLHLCCCGCGTEVVTPISPARWHITFDGETVSLWPSIGSWNQPCQSHYIIRHNRIIECAPWSGRRIADAQRSDRRDIAGHHGEHEPAMATSLLQRLRGWLPWNR
jgi:hypothetical protein